MFRPETPCQLVAHDLLEYAHEGVEVSNVLGACKHIIELLGPLLVHFLVAVIELQDVINDVLNYALDLRLLRLYVSECCLLLLYLLVEELGPGHMVGVIPIFGQNCFYLVLLFLYLGEYYPLSLV